MKDTARMKGHPTVVRGGLILNANGHASLQDILIEDGRILANRQSRFRGIR